MSVTGTGRPVRGRGVGEGGSLALKMADREASRAPLCQSLGQADQGGGGGWGGGGGGERRGDPWHSR